jgi:hypothetical protein
MLRRECLVRANILAFFGVLLCSGALAIRPGREGAQSGQCNQLRPLAGTEGYRQRAAGCAPRCEGLYISDVSSDLQVVSLLRGELEFPLEHGINLAVEAPKGMQEAVNVRAMAIPLRTYYRMDSKLSPGCLMNWPTDEVLLRYAGLRADEVGVFGWIGSEEDKTFIPLTISSSKRYAQSKSLTMIIRAAVEIDKVTAQAIPTDRNQGVQTSRPSPVSTRPPVAAGTPIRVDLSAIRFGAFRVIVEAREQDTESWQILEVRIREG